MITKDLEGYEGRYEITEDGRVFRKERTVKTKKQDGSVYYQKLKRMELSQSTASGYSTVSLTRNKYPKPTLVHRLVAKTFIPNPENKPQVNHINGVKTDNRVENLEWVTPKENIDHAEENNLRKHYKGTEHANSKLNDEDIRKMRNMFDNGVSQTEISKIFNVGITTIWGIVHRKRWKHVK
ncbi:NUMOD4 motif protein [Bacillus mobilis]|uniref:NUMOD4 motif protein n=1 Tax=Bacillus mobilis TaxID=2026190 RepID=A0A1Y5YWN6_9BACI|nr:HNH endonuclease [Bacillus mobilis]SMD67738.1 NUMOD4 motif protein [Bacillus mobilis]